MTAGRTAAVVVFDGMLEWQVALALASLRRYAGYRILTIGFGHLPILAASGLRILPELAVQECVLDGIDVLLVPGGELWERGPLPTMTAFLHRAALMRTQVAAIGTGVAAIAHTGLLDERNHTSDGGDDWGAWLATLAPSYRGQVHRVVGEPIVDRGVITAAGPSTVGFAAALLRTSGVFDAEQLDAWYALHRPDPLPNGRPEEDREDPSER